jgi:hypothetical protein
MFSESAEMAERCMRLGNGIRSGKCCAAVCESVAKDVPNTLVYAFKIWKHVVERENLVKRNMRYLAGYGAFGMCSEAGT